MINVLVNLYNTQIILFISVICSLWHQLQILGGQLTPLTRPFWASAVCWQRDRCFLDRQLDVLKDREDLFPVKLNIANTRRYIFSYRTMRYYNLMSWKFVSCSLVAVCMVRHIQIVHFPRSRLYCTLSEWSKYVHITMYLHRYIVVCATFEI